MPEASPHHTVEAGMFVREYEGGDGGPPVLYLHGLGESGLCFERIVVRPELAGRKHLVPDLPGYGRSPWPGEPLSLPALADHVAVWLRGRAEGPAILVGHSMGGVVALLLAERHPDRVRAVIDVDGNKSLEDCVFSTLAAAFSKEAFLGGGFDAIREAIYRDGADSEALRGYYASLRLCDPRAFYLNSCELVEFSRRETMARRLAALTVPAFYIAGVPDGACARSLELLAEAGVPCTRISPSGHWPFIDRPGPFAAALDRMLASST